MNLLVGEWLAQKILAIRREAERALEACPGCGRLVLDPHHDAVRLTDDRFWDRRGQRERVDEFQINAPILVLVQALGTDNDWLTDVPQTIALRIRCQWSSAL